DRRVISGRPNETSHLEFSKEFVIACIGEDIPEAFLNSIGVFMVTGGPANKKRMTVTPLLETQQPNVYLIGDILSQAYLETDDFKADPTTFREIKHRGNIKAALCDGVLVTEVIAQRIAGKKEIDVELKFVDSAPAQAQQQELPAATPLERVMTSISIPQRVPKEKSEPAPQKPYLVRVIAGSVEEDEFPLNLNGTTTIGRKFCDIVFPDDIYLSERHASIVHGPDGFSLRDDGSSTGVFVKAVEGKSIEVSTSDLLRLGRQFLVFNKDNGSFGFTHYDQLGKEVKRYGLDEKTIVLGREAPDVTLDPKDMTLSRRHLSISVKHGKLFIKDLKSVNGTYLKVRSAVTLEDGDQFRVGQQAFKLSYQKQQAPTKVHVTTRVSIPPKFSQTPLPVAQPAPAVAATGMSVVIRNVGKSFSFAAGQTLCEVAEKGGVKIVAECHAGICGSDPVKIISGKENLNPMGAEEKGTLEDICGVSPEECRLACMAKPKGAVEFEIL
ncbi:MAG: FHA domain-containing protein, partial [Bacteroidetes bacterium]|nr:FHA domain-containing protein [Bacteroidota bacterium]